MSVLTYVLRRLLLVIPTLLGITFVTFLLVNLAPGGPIEEKIRQIRFGSAKVSTRGSQVVSDEVLAAMKVQYGFDQPFWTRYGIWLKNVSRLDFGKSFIYGQPVLEVIENKAPVSLIFGSLSLILTYLIAISAGIFMAYRAEGWIDKGLSGSLVMLSSIPPFVFAILLIVFLAGGSFLSVFPMAYLQSENYETLTLGSRILDRVAHMALPLFCYVIGGLSALALLSRNTILDEIRKDYIRTCRAKGASEQRIYFKHALRNALIPLITGIGGSIAMFLAGSLLIENIFQLNGLGKLGFEALMSRDYNIIMGLTFVQSLVLLIGNLVGDLLYVSVDPRIQFA